MASFFSTVTHYGAKYDAKILVAFDACDLSISMQGTKTHSCFLLLNFCLLWNSDIDINVLCRIFMLCVCGY